MGETAAQSTVVAFEHMTGVMRGAITWLSGPALVVSLVDGKATRISDAADDVPGATQVAYLNRVADSYEVRAVPGQSVWVNGKRIEAVLLGHGDTVEFGDTGPLCRLRLYQSDTQVKHSVPEILGDVATYMRVSRQRPARRVARASGALVGRLANETTLFFRVMVVLVLLVFGFLAYQQQQLNQLLQREIAQNTAQLDSVADSVTEAQREVLRAADLDELRESLEQRVTSNVTRLEELEQRSTASARVIADARRNVVFLQGMYGFRERNGGRMLRQALTPEGVPMMSLRSRPVLTLDGNGPIVELEFTGTGFFIGQSGHLITNRHVALPWEDSAGVDGVGRDAVEPVMLRFLAYRPGEARAVTVSLLGVSQFADLALMQVDDIGQTEIGLELATEPPKSGEEVIVMGYPTGLRSMLAQSGAEFIENIQQAGQTGFWEVAENLAREGYIAPLSSRGIVGQVTASTIVYDADTTHGGSGGPVLDINGRVVAVNSAIIPEYGGSNLGVPASLVRAMLDQAGL